ncbi:MAG: hypothetical protein STSR0003_23470 [Smithella sp.]
MSNEWRVNMADNGWFVKMMKKIGSLFLIFIFLTALVDAAGAEERIVQLTVPGCFS